MRDVRAVLVLGVEKGDEGPFGPEKREMADGRWGKSFFHHLQFPWQYWLFLFAMGSRVGP